MNLKSKPKYILAYYLYEFIYLLFWLIISLFTNYEMVLLYIVSTIVATGWLGYMIVRAFSYNDKEVDHLYLIINILLLVVVSRI